ncbi:hypothetical protein JCM1840_003759 [Sporobolomyces johnsonii]
MDSAKRTRRDLTHLNSFHRGDEVLAMTALLDQLRHTGHCPPAFNPTTNLVALASSSSSSLSACSLFSPGIEHAQHPSVTLSYLSGSPAAPLPRLTFRLDVPTSTSNPRIKHLSFSPCGAYLLCVSGSTDGDEGDDWVTVYEQAASGCINEWETGLHEKVGRFGARGAPMEDKGVQGKEVVSVRWVGEPRKWYPSPSSSKSNSEDPNIAMLNGQKPLYCAPARSAPLSGAAFVAVLTSDEILFVHLPRTSTLLPNVLCMPLHPPPSALAFPSSSDPATDQPSPSPLSLSLTAVPTPPTPLPLPPLPAFPTLLDDVPPAPAAPPSAMSVDHPTPTSSLSQLVGSLVSTLPVVPLPLPADGSTTTGNAALKEELRAAELASAAEGDEGRLRGRRVWRADLGGVRAAKGAEMGETTFLVATLSQPARSRPRRPPASPSSAPAAPLPEPAVEPMPSIPDLPMALSEDGFDLSALDGLDFGSLDAAFGSSASVVPPAALAPEPKVEEKKEAKRDSKEDRDWAAWEKDAYEEDDEAEGRWTVELSEIKIEMGNAEGPRLTVRPQPHFFLSPPSFSPSGDEDAAAHPPKDGQITHLAFLEDTEISRPDAAEGSEPAVDLRLLISVVSSHAPHRSALAAYAMSRESYVLSEAFAGLECRKADVSSVDAGEWSARLAAESTLPNEGLVTALAPRPGGGEVGAFVAVVAEPKSGSEGAEGAMDIDGPAEGNGWEKRWTSKVVVLSSETFLPLSSFSSSHLPSFALYSSLALSPNGALLCALPLASPSRPVIAASPLVLSPAPAGGVEPGKLARRLGIAVARQGDTSDLLGLAASFKAEPEALVALVDQTHTLLQGMIHTTVPLHATALQLELLGLSSTLFRLSPPLRRRAKVASQMLDLAACVRAFKASEKCERGPSTGGGYRCELDAVWPVVGHAGWYAKFVEQLIRDCLAGASDPPPPSLLLLLHPLPRSLLLRIALAVLALYEFLVSLSPESTTRVGTGMCMAEQETVDLARRVLEDAITGGGGRGMQGGMEKWREVLGKVGEIEGLTGGFAFTSTVSTVSIPAALHPQATSVLSLLRESYPSLIPDAQAPPTPPRSPLHVADELAQLDTVRRCRLEPGGRVKECLRCGRRSGAVEQGSAGGAWGEYEEEWRGRCACGGVWRVV